MSQFKKFLFDNFILDTKEEPSMSSVQDNDSSNEYFNDIDSEAEIESASQYYNQQELDIKLDEVKKQSYQEGYNIAKEEKENEYNHLLKSINKDLSILLKANDETNSLFEQQFLDLGLEFLRKIVPTLKEEESTNIIKKFLADNFINFSKEKKLSFYLHPSNISVIGEEIGRLANKFDFEGKISIHKDSSLSLCDCKIEWENGGLIKKDEVTQKNIEEFFKGENK